MIGYGYTLSIMKTNIDAEEGRMIVYSRQEVNRGFCRVKFKEHGVAYLYDLYVEEDHRKQGIGSALIRAAMREAENVGCNVMTLLVEHPSACERDTLRRFYEKFSFNVVYPYSDSFFMSRSIV